MGTIATAPLSREALSVAAGPGGVVPVLLVVGAESARVVTVALVVVVTFRETVSSVGTVERVGFVLTELLSVVDAMTAEASEEEARVDVIAAVAL